MENAKHKFLNLIAKSETDIPLKPDLLEGDFIFETGLQSREVLLFILKRRQQLKKQRNITMKILDELIETLEGAEVEKIVTVSAETHKGVIGFYIDEAYTKILGIINFDQSDN